MFLTHFKLTSQPFAERIAADALWQDDRVSEVVVRPMRPEDVPLAERLSAATFLELDRRTLPKSWPDPVERPPGRAEKWVERTLELLAARLPQGALAAA